jgi:protoporphyrinogen oxidase
VGTLLLELKKPLSDYYWTNIHDWNCPFGLMIEHTNFISSKIYGCNLMYLSSYVPNSNEDFFSLSDDELYRLYTGYLRRMFRGFDESDVIRYHAFKEKYSNPMISIDYSAKMPSFETPIKGLFLAERSQLNLLQQGTDNCVRLARAFLRSGLIEGHKKV